MQPYVYRNAARIHSVSKDVYIGKYIFMPVHIPLYARQYIRASIALAESKPKNFELLKLVNRGPRLP